jgi:hypothetical protein
VSADLDDDEVAGERFSGKFVAAGERAEALFEETEGVEADVTMTPGQKLEIGEDGVEAADRAFLDEVTGEDVETTDERGHDAGMGGQ